MDNWRPLEAHASTKSFFRGEWDGVPALLIRFEGGKEEKERFSALTRFLLDEKIPVPSIFHDPGEADLITEFIEGELFSNSKYADSKFGEAARIAISFNRIEPERFPAGHEMRTLGKDRLKFEMDFFLEHFCRSFLSESPPDELEESLHELAEEVGVFPRLFCHRDLHSDNIIVSRGQIRVVDYQDALMAPRAYDLASLFVDGYRPPEAAERRLLCETAEQDLGIGRIEFRKTALQRAVKALGTFGFQVTKRKKNCYLDAMKKTAPRVGELACDETLLKGSSVDYLRSIEKKLT